MLNPIKTTDFNAIRLKLASPEEILSWSNGEVMKPETINYRTQKPEKDGLFCEKIFGPSKDWECYCGKYKKIRYKGIICDKCGVEVTRSIVRRERMGHITLHSPCVHIWFLRGLSSKLSLILDISMQAIEKVIYFTNFIITDVNENLKAAAFDQIKQEYQSKKKSINNEYKQDINQIKNTKSKLLKTNKDTARVDDIIISQIDNLTKQKDEKLKQLENLFIKTQKELLELKPLTILTEDVYQNLSLRYGHIFSAGIGAKAIQDLLTKIDLDATIQIMEQELKCVIDLKKDKLIRRLKIFKSFKQNNIKPEWMIMTVIPVVPPDMRPMVALDGGRFAASDLNDLYRRVINRNNRLKHLIDLNAPEIIQRNEKRMLQEAVDSLIDNSARNSKTTTASTGQKRQLKSLADSLKGKQGRFRQNLLGKRVDYSGRSVIVVNPKLKLNECGLPKIMALELFKPFIISQLIKKEVVHNVRSAVRFIEAGYDMVWDILDDIIAKDVYLLLNRAPTLHRLGIQAFKPILIEGKAIQIHPLVCVAFNADFDGDQMAVHIPLTKEAKAEVKDIILSSRNLLKPATGDPVVIPSQDIVWGIYYMTNIHTSFNDNKFLKFFASKEEAQLSYDLGYIKINQLIKIKIKKSELIETTMGRVIFNDILPEKLRFFNKTIKKTQLINLIKDCLRFCGEERTVKFVDDLKDLGFKFITKSGLSLSIDDFPDFLERDQLLDHSTVQVEKIQDQYEEGLLTDSERSSKVIESWTHTKEQITDICKTNLSVNSPVYSMIESGARGSWAQLTQILGMKGLVVAPSGIIIELPVKGNYKKGFGVLEYFISSHGARKGLSDTALRTANAGYLTRRLVDVSQDVIIIEEDCKDTEGILFTKKESEEMDKNFFNRIIGRFLAKDLQNSKGTILVKSGELLTEDIIDKIKTQDVNEAVIRSVLSCKTHKGVCVKCYGYDLGYNKLVKLGTAVGIIAAQSIGEPGTQLTMRTIHTGGVAGQEDITQGLPRVEEIFEVHSPKQKALIADVSGKITIESVQRTIINEKGKEIIVNDSQAKILKINYQSNDSQKYYFSDLIKKIKLQNNYEQQDVKLEPKIFVKNGDIVKKNEKLFSINKKLIKAKEAGKVKIKSNYIQISATLEKVKEFIIQKGTAILVDNGAIVEKGDQLTEGSLNLEQLYKLKGCLATQKYIIKEIQSVYSSQGQFLNDKHIEIIARQMFSRYFIKDSGDTDLLPGETVEEAVLVKANKQVKRKATAIRLLLGITKVSLTTDSFLAAASFQQTAQVLIDAAINCKIDYLEGLKENIIIGCLIPSGTGYRKKIVR